MRLVFVDPNAGLISAIKAYFKDLPNVETVEGYFEELPEYDCMVSPANSFGLMDGGVDAAITQYFGVQLMERVQQRILEDYLGEQPVGTSIIVETGHPKHPFLAHTPTMRIPRNIAQTENVYLAMWALLRAVSHHNKRSAQVINSIACPGLGTGVGEVPYQQAARQMALAYSNFLNPPQSIKGMNWEYAAERHVQIRLSQA